MPDGNPAPGPNWDAVKRRLQEERKKVLPTIDTDAAIAEYQLAFQIALSAEPITRTTGLIEQQACFISLKNLAGKEP